MSALKLVLIEDSNLKRAVDLAQIIFPYEYDENKKFLPEEEYLHSLNGHRSSARFYIAELDGVPVGITGYNTHFKQPKETELWLGYFGLDPQYRGRGLGKVILERTITLLKEDFPDTEVLKILTSMRPEEILSHGLYRKVGAKLYAKRPSTNQSPAAGFKWLYFKLFLS